MIQLSYQPAFDPFHTIFRILRILVARKNHVAIQRDKLNIVDFYLLFPFRITDVRLTQAHRHFRKLAKAYEWSRPYGAQPEAITIFNRMDSIHTAALATLAANGFIDSVKMQNGLIDTKDALPKELFDRITETNRREEDLMDFLMVLVTDYELGGPSGLKARTELMEYRYDSV